MSMIDRLRDLKDRVAKTAPFAGRARKEVEVPYGKYRNIVRSLKPKSEHLSFTERDPRVNLHLPEGGKNLYLLQYILSGEAVENATEGRLEMKGDILSHSADEFDRNEALSQFEQTLEQQQDLLHKKIFYAEREITIPEFDFAQHAYEIEISALITNRSIALHDILFIWDHNLTGFDAKLRIGFDDENQARAWKRSAGSLKLGMVFHVVTMADRLWNTGMPATVCFVVGFAFVDSNTGQVLNNPPVQVFGKPGPHERIARNRDQIRSWVESRLATIGSNRK